MIDSMAATVMPPNATLVDGNKILAGSRRSRKRLEELNFDPMQKLVRQYNELEAEDIFLKELRKVTAVVQHDARGKEIGKIKYSAMYHVSVIAQMGKISEGLLRYGYGRIPESVTVNNDTDTPMVINLTGKKIVDPKSIPIMVVPKMTTSEDDY